MTSVRLNIKTPCQEYDDQEIFVQINWTVRKVKQEIERSFSHHPRPHDQRLVYAGKLLQDDWILQDLLRHDNEELNSHTMHLVCRQVSPPAATIKAFSQTGLRHRNVSSANKAISNSGQSNSGASSNEHTNDIPTASATTASSNGNAFSETGTSNPWQSYLESQAMTANQNEQYIMNQTPEQAIMMQQMYAHYMTQYIQYIQSGNAWNQNINGAVTNGDAGQADPHQMIRHNAGAAGLNPMAAGAAVAAVVGGHSPPTGGQQEVPPNEANLPGVAVQNHAALPQDQAPPAAAGAAVPAMNGPGANAANMMMNAGGGGMAAMEEDDEDGVGGGGGQRDILDWFYVASKVLVLFSIVYFYSSLARFALVAGLGMAVYLYRMGFFGQRRQPGANDHPEHINNLPVQQNNAQPAPDAANQRNPDGVENNPRHVNEIETEATPQENQDGSAPHAAGPVQQLEQSWHHVIATFVTTFFTSLMPNEPQVI